MFHRPRGRNRSSLGRNCNSWWDSHSHNHFRMQARRTKGPVLIDFRFRRQSGHRRILYRFGPVAFDPNRKRNSVA